MLKLLEMALEKHKFTIQISGKLLINLTTISVLIKNYIFTLWVYKKIPFILSLVQAHLAQ